MARRKRGKKYIKEAKLDVTDKNILIGRKQIAAYLGLSSENLVSRLVHRGMPVSFGRPVTTTKDAIDNWMRTRPFSFTASTAGIGHRIVRMHLSRITNGHPFHVHLKRRQSRT